ncbi:HNH endonuclease [Microbacterium schleiferi]|uniref:HNH endonuclease n=1 Tax=Microbacterium schleiferi TaxID=69362 RepID=UPI0035AB8344|nr:HNH endonuclease [Microbacterium schleiferi]
MTWKSGGPSRTSTPQHRAWREAVINRAGWQCEIRDPHRCTGTATEADHIIEVTDRPDLEHDLNNGQATCPPCHAHKTALHANTKRWTLQRRNSTHPQEQHPGLT